MEAVEKKRSRGGFLHIFDWPGKSKKKLFSSNNTKELSEEPTQEKQNAQNLSKSLLSHIDADETGKASTYNPRSDSSCSTSTVTSDDGQGSRAPSVVARLMGLESLPVSSSSLEPRSNPDFDPFFLRSSRKMNTWDAYENLGYVNLRTDYDGVSWDHLDSSTYKEQNRPIDRFRTETLPPRSAKPISVTHNRLLSPIRSPGFVQSRNPAYVMEAASRMIEPSSRIASKARFSSPDSSSSSLPMRIRDLKEKLEASSQKGPVLNGTRNNKLSRGKYDEKRTTSPLKTQEANKLLGKNSSDSLKGRVKPPSVSTHRQNSSLPSNGNRIQKEKMETKNRAIKNGLKEPSASTRKAVIKPKNPKGSQVTNKAVGKALVETGTTSKKPIVATTSAEKNTTLSLSRKKNLPRNKKPPNGVQEPGSISDKRVKRDEKLIKCNITVDGGLKTGEKDRKKDMDVISFTFSSPIKGLSSDSRSSNKKTEQDTRSSLCFNHIDSDSLNILLEQKLRELTSKIESSCSSLTQEEEEEESSGSISKDWVNGTISLPSDDLDKVLSEKQDTRSSLCFNHIDSDSLNILLEQKLRELTSKIESSCSSLTQEEEEESSGSISKDWGEDQEVHSFHTATEAKKLRTSCPHDEETEHSESFVMSEFEEGPDWEFEYITEIIDSDQLMVEEVSLGMASDVLPMSLFDKLEDERDARGNMERKSLFDFVNQWLTLKCEEMFIGKEGMMMMLFERRDVLAEEVKKEIQRLKKRKEMMMMMMMDELVENDMSSVEGKWIDYKREAFEQACDIEQEIVSDLVDDLVNDFLLCF
ncbi:unnamed protein product [Cochlearia groenlandica]